MMNFLINLIFPYDFGNESLIKVQEVVDFEAIRDRILFDLKLGRQASGYKTAQKGLNRLITELKYLANRF